MESSIGHIRDLPNNASEVPAKYKGESWGRLGVNVDDGFTPVYVVPTDKKQQITKLKSLLKDADELYLATDEDREGEAIAWHLLRRAEAQGSRHAGWCSTRSPGRRSPPPSPTRVRSTYDLVDAQEARRILDRLYGYEVSPVLWKKVMAGCRPDGSSPSPPASWSTGSGSGWRFRAAAYWDLEATLRRRRGGRRSTSPPSWSAVDGKRVAQGADFTPPAR